MNGTIVTEKLKGAIAIDSFYVTEVDTSDEALALVKEKLTEMGFAIGVNNPFRYTEIAHLFGNTKDRLLFMASLSLLITESGSKVFVLSKDHSTVITPVGGINVDDITGFAEFSAPVVKVKLTQKKNQKYTITCKKGTASKPVTGTAPKCPKGFKKVA